MRDKQPRLKFSCYMWEGYTTAATRPELDFFNGGFIIGNDYVRMFLTRPRRGANHESAELVTRRAASTAQSTRLLPRSDWFPYGGCSRRSLLVYYWYQDSRRFARESRHGQHR